MAVSTTPLLLRRQSLLAKIEATTGTAETLAATDGQFNIYNVAWNDDIPMEQRPGQAGFKQLAAIHGHRWATVDFDADIVGSGASGQAAWTTTFLLACGFTQASNVFSLAYQASQPTLTIGGYFDGLKKAIAGAAGTVSFNLRTGMNCLAHFRFMGKIVADSDVALVTPTAFNTLPPRFAGNTVTYDSYTPHVTSIEIDVNNTLSMYPSQSDATGAIACYIVNRDAQISMDPQMSLVATYDWYTKLTTHNAAAFSAALGTASNNIMTWAASALQPMEIAMGNRDGYLSRAFRGQCNNDALTLTMT